MSKPDIAIYKISHSTISLQTNPTIERELKQFFSAMAPNYRFNPKYKMGYWTGRLYFFDYQNEMAIGLIEHVHTFAKMGNYTVECMFERFNEVDRSEFKRFVDSLALPFPIRDYQFEAAYQAVCKRHLNILASTASGKSLIIYVICRFMLATKQKVLLIAPQQQLVEQMFSDFVDYGWDSERYCHRLYSGQKKLFDKPVTIACWQSMTKDKKLLSQFDCLIVDEAHTAQGVELKKIAAACINADYRYGFSGTYPEASTADWFTIVGSLGPIQTFATYKSLQEKKHIVDLKIYSVILEYSRAFKREVYIKGNKDYRLENDLIYGNEARNKFLLKLVQNLTNNTLILATKKEKHTYILKEIMEKGLIGKQVVYIDGDKPLSEREEIRALMETRNDLVLIATYSTLSAGVNIKNLYNICFASGYKSMIKVLQSIGRSLRLSPGKTHAKLFDIVDNCSFTDKINNIKYENYGMKHHKIRTEIYEAQGWIPKVVRYKI